MLRFLGDGGRDPRDLVEGFRSFLLLHVTFRYAYSALEKREGEDFVLWLVATGAMAACFLCTLRPGWGRIATCGALVLLLIKVFALRSVWYGFSNHMFIETACTATLAFWNPSIREERDLSLVFLRAFTVLVLFYTGLQKAWYGTYFDGQYLAHRISIDPSYEVVFRALIPGAEFERLMSLDGSPGDGPYRLEAPWLVLLANLTWIAEMGIAALLAVPRLRSWGVGGALVLLIAIEIAAREMEFGALFANLVLLFLPVPWHRRMLPVFAAMYLVVLVMRLGWIPEFRVT